MPLKPLPPGIEVSQRGVLPLLAAFEAFPSMLARHLLKHGIAATQGQSLVPQLQVSQAWIPLDAWLKTLAALAQEVGPNALFQCGMRITANARFPSVFVDLESALRSIDVTYHMEHRHNGRVMFDPRTRRMLEGIGHYAVDPTPQGHEIRIVSDVPYPCPSDLGIVTGIARSFEPRAITQHDESAGCRAEGGERCVYVVTW